MDKQDEGLKLLNDIESIGKMIEDIQIQIDELYSMLTSTTVKPKDVDVQTSQAPDPMADKIIVIMEYKEKLENYQLELVKKKETALSVIKQMDISMQRVLLLRYFKGLTIEEVGDRIGYTYRWAWEKVHQAEELFIQIYAMNCAD